MFKKKKRFLALKQSPFIEKCILQRPFWCRKKRTRPPSIPRTNSALLLVFHGNNCLALPAWAPKKREKSRENPPSPTPTNYTYLLYAAIIRIGAVRQLLVEPIIRRYYPYLFYAPTKRTYFTYLSCVLGSHPRTYPYVLIASTCYPYLLYEPTSRSNYTITLLPTTNY